MKFLHWLTDELKLLVGVTVYFAACFALIMVLKQLLLAQYGIRFSGLATAMLVALVTAKVVIVLQKVPISRWLQHRPPFIDVLVRTAFYTVATMAALLLEKAFEARGEYGGFGAALAGVFEHRDVHQVWATIIWTGVAFLAYNAFGVLRREVGGRELARIFFSSPAARS
jgi:hypothetical protein